MPPAAFNLNSAPAGNVSDSPINRVSAFKVQLPGITQIDVRGEDAPPTGFVELGLYHGPPWSFWLDAFHISKGSAPMLDGASGLLFAVLLLVA